MHARLVRYIYIYIYIYIWIFNLNALEPDGLNNKRAQKN